MQPLPEFDPDMVLEDHAAPLDTYDSPRCYSTPIPGNRGSLDVSGQLSELTLGHGSPSWEPTFME